MGRGDDASSVSSRTSEFAFGTMELHEQYSAMLKKYEDQRDVEKSTSLEETSPEKRGEMEEEEEELESAASTLSGLSSDPVEVRMLLD